LEAQIASDINGVRINVNSSYSFRSIQPAQQTRELKCRADDPPDRRGYVGVFIPWEDGHRPGSPEMPSR